MRDAEEETFPELVSRVVDDAKAVGRAELAVLRAQARLRMLAYRDASLLLGGAALAGMCAAIALTVGTLMVFAACVGPGWATLIVVAVLLVLAALLGWLGIDRARVTRRLQRERRRQDDEQ